MNDEELQKYIDICYEELEKKQQYLMDVFGFGSFDRFQHDFEKEEIYLLQDSEIKVKAKILPIGSFNTESSTWMWAWANEAFPDFLREKASQLKKLEDVTGFEIFGNKMAEINQDMVWEIAGMSLSLLGFDGVYRGPSKNTQYFYALKEVENITS